MITDEYNCRVLGRSGKKEENVAFYTVDNNGNSNGNGRFAGKCFNCGKKGHKIYNCWAEGSGKAGQGPKKKLEDSTNGKEKMAASSMSTEKEANIAWIAMSIFSMEVDDLFEASELPDLTQLLETDNKECDSNLDEHSAKFEDKDTDDEDNLLVDSAVCSTKKAQDLPDEVHTTIYN